MSTTARDRRPRPLRRRAALLLSGAALGALALAPAAAQTGSKPRSVIPWLEQAARGQEAGGVYGGPSLPPAAANGSAATPGGASYGAGSGVAEPYVGSSALGGARQGVLLDDGSTAIGPPGGAIGEEGEIDPNTGQPNRAAFGAGAANVEVAALQGVKPEAAGVLSAASIGLPVDGWRGVTQTQAAELIERLRPGGLPSANRLSVRLLSVAFEPPAEDYSAAGYEQADFLTSRIEALQRYGAAGAAADVAAAAGAEQVEAAAAAALVSGHETALCRALLGELNSPSLERIYCQAVSGDRLGANVAIAASRDLGEPDVAALEMLEAVADPGLAGYLTPPTGMDGLTALKLAAMRQLDMALPSDFGRAAPPPLLAAALAPNTAPRVQLEALERLEASGAVETEMLADAFRRSDSAESGGVWGRVEALRAAISAPPSDIRRAVATAMSRAQEADRTATMARLLAPELARRAFFGAENGNPEFADAEIRRVLRLGGELDAAHKLFASGDPYAAGAEERALDRIGATTDAAWSPADADQILARSVRGDQEAGRILAALDVFGVRTGEAGQWPRLEDLSFRLQEGRKAEIAFEAAAALSAGDRITPEALHGALTRLVALDMVEEARQIAVEAVILGQ